jgi:hypothetical protein
MALAAHTAEVAAIEMPGRIVGDELETAAVTQVVIDSVGISECSGVRLCD